MKSSKLRKALSLAAAAIMLFALLTACGGSPGSTTTDTTPASTAADDEAADTQPADSGSGLTTQGQHWELTCSIGDPATSVKAIFLETWADRVREATDGQVDITVYPGGVLASSANALEAVLSGTVDIAWMASNYFAGQFPLSEVVTLPMLGIDNVPQGTNVLWDLWETDEALQAELAPYKILMMYINPIQYLFTADKPVASMSDLKGLQIRTLSGCIGDTVTLWGATPISMGPPDVYEAMEKHVIDGFTFDYSGVTSYNLQEVTGYYTDLSICENPIFLMMNPEVWASFPADIQAAIDSVSDRACSLEMAELFQADDDAQREIALSYGDNQLVTVSDEAYAEFAAVASDYRVQWAETTSSTLGIDAQAFLDKAIELAAQYAD